VSPRTTAIVFAVGAALFAFIYLYEIRGGEARKEAEQAEKRLFGNVEATDVQALAFRADGRDVRIERRDGGWELTEPLVFPGDEFAADGMASALADLESQSVYRDPQARDVYGLGDGALEIRFEAGGEPQTVRIGDKTPMGSNTYVSVSGDDAVYTVSSFSVNALRKSLDDLRDKRVAHFDRAAVDRVEASWPGGSVVLEKDGEGWRLLEPIQDRADAETVESLLTDLSFLRASGFDDDPPSDAEAGLEAPAFRAVLTGAAEPVSEDDAETAESQGEPLRVEIAIGSRVEEGERLVQSAAASLYRIPTERLDELPRELVDYRFKQLADFAPSDAQRVEIVFQRLVSSPEGDEPLRIVATRGETGWTSEPEAFQSGKLSGMLSELSRLKADRILADAMGEDELADLGLSPPNTEILVFGEQDAPLARVKLGLVRGDEGIVAQSADDPKVFQIAHGIGEFVPVNLDAFRSRFRAAPGQEPEAGGAPEANDSP
jgi:hypothetical protein